jgi:hypothetical protein
VQRRGQGHVAAIGEWCDDQTATVAQVLVKVRELRVGLSHDTEVGVGVAVEPELLRPQEVFHGCAVIGNHFVDDIASVYFDRDQGVDLLANHGLDR